MDKLDSLDKRIMYELDLNSRISASQLARTLGRSKETVNFRINRLIEKGYLKGFYAVFNTSKLGWYYYKVYLKLKDITPEKEKGLFEYLQNQEHVAYLAEVEGYYDCIFLVMVRNSKNMVDFLNPFMKMYGMYIQEKEVLTFLTAHRINQRFLFSGEIKKDWHYPVEIGDYKLDDVDLRILDSLSTDARMHVIDIAGKVGVDHKIVKYRMKKLEKDGIILAYVSAPNSERLGLLFVQMNISLKDPTLRKSIIEHFVSTGKCLFAIELLGKYDLTIELHVGDNDELKNIIDGFRTRFVNTYNDYDVSTINEEYVMVWSPFADKRTDKKTMVNKMVSEEKGDEYVRIHAD